MAFYRINFLGKTKELAVYQPLIGIKPMFGVCIQGVWSKDLRVIELSHIITIVGIWRVPDTEPERIYVLQKHPGLEMLMLQMPEKAEAEVEDFTEDSVLDSPA